MSHNAKELPDQSILLGRYTYNPETGEVISKKSGEPLRRKDPSGYIIVTIENKTRRLNRVIWKMHTGLEPHGIVEYIDGNPDNNKWENLRCVSESDFAINKMIRDQENGLEVENNGVSFFKRTKTWRVQLRIGNQKYAKYGFKSEADAIEHAKQKRQEIIENYKNRDAILEEKKERVELFNDLFDGDITL